MYNFEKLEVWQVAIEFTSDIYKVTSNFPEKERFGLISQLRRASVSVASNIAEGAGRHYRQDHIRFLRMALGSIYETVTQLFVARNEGFVDSVIFKEHYQKSERISKMLYRLIDALNNDNKSSTVDRHPTTKRSDIEKDDGHRSTKKSSIVGHRKTSPKGIRSSVIGRRSTNKETYAQTN